MKAYLGAEEIYRMEKIATNLRDRLLITVLFHVGCRISEALKLEVKDIDFSECTITIEHLKSRIRLSCCRCNARLGKGHTFCPKCGAKVEQFVAEEKERRRMRTLPVDKETLDLFADYIKRGGAVAKSGKKLIFGINRHRAWQIIKDCAEKAGLPKLINSETGKVHHVSPHRLRDAFAVKAVKHDDTGDGLRMLQEHLGHQSISTTMRYRKVSGEEHKQWYRRLWEEQSNA